MSPNNDLSARITIRGEMTHAESGRFVSGNAEVFSLQSPSKNAGENEDACALISLSDQSGLMVLADGVGGHRGGQDASALAVETMAAFMQKSVSDQSNLREPVLDAIEECNQALLADGLGAATTLLVVELQGRSIRPYYIGDSTILVCGQRGKLKFQSIAQSPTGYALEAGVMEEAEVRTDEDRHLVSNIIGVADMHMTVGSWLNLAPKDTLLMCSDGLTDNIYIDAIVDKIRTGRINRSAQVLKEQCLEKMASTDGHPDDLSFILFRLRN